MSLIVTGTVGIDTVHAPTGRVERVLGGSVAYFAAAASFHAGVRVVAAAGDDWPDEHRRTLEGFRNVSLEGLEVRGGSRTFAWGGRYHENMNQRETLFTQLGVLEEDPPAVPASYLDSQYVFLANTHPVEQARLLKLFPKRKLAFADTMDLWINIAHGELMELFTMVDGVVLNDEEALLLTEIPNAVTAARTIAEWGPRYVIVKKGEHGAILVGRDRVATVPAFPAEAHQVVDPTGAGDSFAGGLMGYVAAQDQIDFATIQAGIAWGTVIASFTIESFSLDRLARLTRAEIDERMREFQSAARIA